jgi:hypothetical protein
MDPQGGIGHAHRRWIEGIGRPVIVINEMPRHHVCSAWQHADAEIGAPMMRLIKAHFNQFQVADLQPGHRDRPCIAASLAMRRVTAHVLRTAN